MFHSVTLKRSLLQISKAKPTAGCVCRTMSQAGPYWEGAVENSKNSDDSTSHICTGSNYTTKSNGIIRFNMTPKPQHASSMRGYGTSNHDQHTVDACDNPFFDRTAAAEQMAKQMEDSYYYASFKATSSDENQQQSAGKSL